MESDDDNVCLPLAQRVKILPPSASPQRSHRADVQRAGTPTLRHAALTTRRHQAYYMCLLSADTFALSKVLPRG